ncbi:MAG: hypothetical protein V3U31_07010 [Dehalococcoidia bacterium]
MRELVHRASRDNPHLTSRLEKAAFLVLLRPVLSLGDDHYRVGSEDGLKYYEVRNGHCACTDYVRHGPGHPCKHRLALTFHQTLRCAESWPVMDGVRALSADYSPT